MRRAMAYVWAMLVIAALSLTQFASAGGGGGGGGKKCVNERHSRDVGFDCVKRRDNRGRLRCMGNGCTQLRWISRTCIDGNETCEPSRARVSLSEYRAPCADVPNAPTCQCGEYRFVRVSNEQEEVDWCTP